MAPAPHPVSRFKNGERDPRRCKSRGGTDSSGARSDYDHVEIVYAAAKHEGSFRIDPTCWSLDAVRAECAQATA
jgi:hypothetical protein